MRLANKTDNPKDYTSKAEIYSKQQNPVQRIQCFIAAHLWARKEKVGAGKETRLPKAKFHGVLRWEIET